MRIEVAQASTYVHMPRMETAWRSSAAGPWCHPSCRYPQSLRDTEPDYMRPGFHVLANICSGRNGSSSAAQGRAGERTFLSPLGNSWSDELRGVRSLIQSIPHDSEDDCMRSTPARSRPHRCSLALLTGTGSCILHRGDLVCDIAEVRMVLLSRVTTHVRLRVAGLTTDNRHGLHPGEASRAVLVRCTP